MMRTLEINANLLAEWIAPILGESRFTEIQRLFQTRITVIQPDGVVVGDSKKDPVTRDNHADQEVAGRVEG